MKLSPHTRNEIISCIIVAIALAALYYVGIKLGW